MKNIKTIIITGFFAAFLLGLMIKIIKLTLSLISGLPFWVAQFIPFHSLSSESVKFLIEMTTLLVFALILGLILNYWHAKKNPFEQLIANIPVVNAVVNFFIAMKNTFGFWIEQKNKQKKNVDTSIYNKWVLGELFPGRYMLGLISEISIKEITEKLDKERIGFYLPSTPNPITGYYYILPSDKIIPLNIPFEIGLQIIATGGFVKTADFDNQNENQKNDPSP